MATNSAEGIVMQRERGGRNAQASTSLQVEAWRSASWVAVKELKLSYHNKETP